MATKTDEQTAIDYLERAVDDLKQAGQDAGDEVRSAIDSAIGRAREALEDLRAGAGERAERFRSRTEDRASEWQQALDDANEDVRRELGLRAVRAQRSKDSLDALADEIKGRRKELKHS
jgi:uncharacterized protein YicC (UPF0701 family)